MFKNIIFDFDNTLYDYESANKKAIDTVFCKLTENFNLNNVNDTYEKEKKKFQNYCSNASSHNKFIQLKKIFEKYNLDLNQLNFYYNLYINIFINNFFCYTIMIFPMFFTEIIMTIITFERQKILSITKSTVFT